MRTKTGSSFYSNLKFSWQATALYSVAGILAFITAFPNQDVPFGTRCGLALVLASVVAAAIYFLSFALNALTAMAPRWHGFWFTTSVLLVGLVRGACFVYLVDASGLQQPTPEPVRLFSSTITTLIWLTLSCALIEATVNYSKRFANLFSQTTLAVAMRNTSLKVSSSAIDSLANLVALKRNLSTILSETSASGLTPEVLWAAGAAVRAQIEEQIRPLSHRLWFNEKRNRTSIRLFGLVSDSLSQFTFNGLRFTLVWGALEFASIVNAYSLGRVVFGVFLSTSLLAISAWVFRKIPASVAAKLGRRLNIFFIFFMALVPIAIADALMPLFGFERILFPASAATFFAPLAALVLLTVESCLSLVEHDRALVASLFKSEIEGRSGSTSTSLASYLHNSLQSELTGIAYRLEASAADPESHQTREALERLGAIINRSISEDFANFEETPLVRLERTISAWDGIANVSVSIPDDCKGDLKKLNLLVQIIEEATTNSVRHGKARNIEVLVSKTDDEVGLVIEITTDSQAAISLNAGLGTSWLQETALNEASLVRTETGTRLVTEI